MPKTDRAQFEELILKIEQDLFNQALLRDMLAAADAKVTTHQASLRVVKRRMARARQNARPKAARR